MKFQSKKRALALIIGDLVLFILALWMALFVRNLSLPDEATFFNLLAPFSFVFLTWILVFYIADLYGKHTSIFRRKLPRVILNAQIANSLIAVVFFYFIPYFGVTPKTILFIDLFFSFLFIFAWRSLIIPNIHLGQKEKILFACKGREVEEIIEEVKGNPRYDISIANPTEVKNAAAAGLTAIVVNLYDENIEEALKNFYQLIFSGVRFISVHNLYEEIFDREPVSLLKEQWFLENISNHPKPIYDSLKRLMDISVAFLLGLVSLVVYPLVWLAIKLDDGGVIFSEQERIGKDNQPIKMLKFRTMKFANDGGRWGSEDAKQNEVTRVGRFLRKTRLDEIPQLWNVLKGDLSLIGPRPEFADPVALYSQEIKFYNIRHIIKPGLSGWAQINQEAEPHHSINTTETGLKFSYDLFYIKNRSFWLDLSIALKTIKILVLQKGH